MGDFNFRRVLDTQRDPARSQVYSRRQGRAPFCVSGTLCINLPRPSFPEALSSHEALSIAHRIPPISFVRNV
jgi:hypothetical protein